MGVRSVVRGSFEGGSFGDGCEMLDRLTGNRGQGTGDGEQGTGSRRSGSLVLLCSYCRLKHLEILVSSA